MSVEIGGPKTQAMLERGIREICNKNEWLMISDEVLTGMGRTGEMAREVMGGWEEKYKIVRQVRLSGLLMGVSFQSPNEDEKDLWYAREVRSRSFRKLIGNCGFSEQQH